MEEINRHIEECEEMITHFILLKEIHHDQVYAKELAYWRKMLQHAKKIKREKLATT